MNNTKIEWTDKTINPYVGCKHGCWYCYARGQAKRQKHRCQLCYEFTPHPHLERLDQITPRQKPMNIFIDSMWDWNGTGIKKSHLLKIKEKFWECPQHTFQILSKRPEGYARFNFPDNVWLGTTITKDKELERMYTLVNVANGNIKFISFEPLLQPVSFSQTDSYIDNIDWLIIGGLSGKKHYKPDKEAVNYIIRNARARDIPVFIKDNLKWHEKIQEFPEKPAKGH